VVLAVPAPPVRPAGSKLTASIYGSDVTDDITFLTNPPDFVGTQSVAQSLANNTWTPLSMDTEQLDSYGGHSTSSNTSRYVAQVAGWYTASGIYAAAVSGTGFRAVRLQVNGTAVFGCAAYVPNNGTAETGVVTPTRDIFLNVGDYVEVAGWQLSGGALNTHVSGTDQRCGLWVRFSHA
jgi:hypothetical protein